VCVQIVRPSRLERPAPGPEKRQAGRGPAGRAIARAELPPDAKPLEELVQGAGLRSPGSLTRLPGVEEDRHGAAVGEVDEMRAPKRPFTNGHR
jgi:hypothetical protein